MEVLVALLFLQADLVRNLADDSIEVRDRAARLLRAIGEEALPDLRNAGPDPERQARARVLIRQIEAETGFDPRVISRHPELAAALQDGDCFRVLALSSTCGEDEFEGYALKCLTDPNPDAWKTAILLLRNARDGSPVFRRVSVSLVIPMIEGWTPEPWKDWDRKLLQWIFWFVLNRVSEKDRDQLARAKAGHIEAQQALRILQAAVGLPEATDTLVELLGRGTPWLRVPALIAARKTRCAEARDAVARLLDGPRYREEAAKTLRELDAPSPAPVAAAPSEPEFRVPARTRIDVPTEALLKMLEEWDAGLEIRKTERRYPRRCGLEAAYASDPPDGGDILFSIAATGDRSRSALFVDRLASPDRECQQEAIRVCGEWKLQDAAPVLRRLVRVGRAEVRAAALKSLALVESK